MCLADKEMSISSTSTDEQSASDIAQNTTRRLLKRDTDVQRRWRLDDD